MGSRFDQIYRRILLCKIFSNGWGKPENLRKIFAFRKVLSCRDSCMKLVDHDHPITIKKEVDHGDHLLLEAEFLSPLVNYLPGLLPKESEKAHFQMIIPKVWKSHLRPVCLHMAGTGDHGFWRRRILMGKPMLQETGIASIFHENPFYGCRKPKDQHRSSLRNVSDLFLMGGCLVLESLAIFHWAERQGYGPLGITGISMGGHMASLAASIWHKPITLIPCLSWSTASGVFTQGVMSGSINWEMLKNQYFSDKVFRDELFNMIQSPEGHFRVYHEVGQEFARNFPESLNHVEKLKLNSKNTDFKSNIKKTIKNPLDLFKNLTATNPSAKSNSKEFNMDKNNNFGDEVTPVVIRPVTAEHQPPVSFQPYVTVRDPLTWEAVQFMRGVMDECTHIGNFSKPIDPSLIIIVAAKDDAYMPRDGFIPLSELWPGSELRVLDKGHITAFLFNQQMFRNAVKDGFERIIDKYYSDPINTNQLNNTQSEMSSRNL